MDEPTKPEAPATESNMTPGISGSVPAVSPDASSSSAVPPPAAVPPSSPPPAATPLGAGGAVAPPSPVAAKKKRWPLLGIGIFVLLLLIFVGGLMYIRQNLYKEINKHAQGGHTAMNMDNMTTTDGTMVMNHALLNPKVLTIGIDPTFQPMEYKNEKGEIVGYDADLGREIAHEMAVDVVFKTISWDDIFTALEHKDIDIIISSVSITDERKQKYGFSEPYLNAGQVILTRKATATITKPTDLAGKKVGAQVSTTSIQEAQKYGATTVSYPDPNAAIQDLISGKIDAVIADLPAAKGYTDTDPTIKIASDPFTSEYYGIVVRKNDTELQKHIDQIIIDLQQKGVLADLKEKWLE